MEHVDRPDQPRRMVQVPEALADALDDALARAWVEGFDHCFTEGRREDVKRGKLWAHVTDNPYDRTGAGWREGYTAAYAEAASDVEELINEYRKMGGTGADLDELTQLIAKWEDDV